MYVLEQGKSTQLAWLRVVAGARHVVHCVSEFVAFCAYLVYPENWKASGATSRGIGMTACYTMDFAFIVYTCDYPRYRNGHMQRVVITIILWLLFLFSVLSMYISWSIS